jgi:hypothetical protein
MISFTDMAYSSQISQMSQTQSIVYFDSSMGIHYFMHESLFSILNALKTTIYVY